jgi:outer membrane protein assembly factor BamA
LEVLVAAVKTLRVNRLWPSWLFLLLAICGVSEAAKVHFEVSGQRGISRGKILELLDPESVPLTTDSSEWDGWIESTVSLLEIQYQNLGYFQARAEIRPEWKSVGDSLVESRIQIQLQEGTRFAFRNVVIDTGDAPGLVEVQDLRCNPKRYFDRDLVSRDNRDILRAYGNAGFLHVKSTESWRLDSLSHSVDLVFHIDAGKPLVFDTLLLRIEREGEEVPEPGLTSPRLLRNLLQLNPGDTLSLRKTSTFERKLRSTHVFNTVRLKDSLLDSADGRTAMILKLEERVPGEMELSGFYETQFGPGFSGSWTHSNLLGHLHEANTVFSIAQKRQTYFLGYASLLFLTSPFRFDFDLTLDWQQESEFAAPKSFFSGDFIVENQARLSRSFGSHFRYIAGAEFRGRSQLVDSNSNRLRDFNLNWLNSVYVTFLDDNLNPTRGSRFGFTVGNGGPIFALGEINVFQDRHNWLEMESAYYWPLFPWLNLACRMDGGRFIGKADFNPERFFLGGNRNVRSHNWRSVCPELDSLGHCRFIELEPVYVLGSGELRLNPFPNHWAQKNTWIRHLPGIQVVPFIDYGLIWEVDKAVKPSGRGRSFGLGMRYVLFNIFNLRVDYAVDPYRRDSDGARFSRWVLDLAQAF